MTNNGWISVDERLPQNSFTNRVLVRTEFDNIEVLVYQFDAFRTECNQKIDWNIKWWMPITDEGWITPNEHLPGNGATYLAITDSYTILTLHYYDGFNCWLDSKGKARKDQEIQVMAWKPIPTLDHDTCRPFKFSSTKGMVDHIINSLESDNNCEQDYCSQGIMDDLYELKEMMEVGR